MVDPTRTEIDFATVTHCQDNVTRAQRMTVAKLHQVYQAHARQLVEKDGAAVIGAVFRRGRGRTKTTRLTENTWRQAHLIERVTILQLDFDEHCLGRAEVEHPWRGVCHISYSTPSYGVKPGERMRLVLPLARPVSVEDHALLWAWARDRSPAPVDQSCSDPGRIMYTPRRLAEDAQPGTQPWCDLHAAPLLDPDALPDGSSLDSLRDEADARAAALREAQDAAGRGAWTASRDVREDLARAMTSALRTVKLGRERRPALFKGAARVGEALRPIVPGDDDTARGDAILAAAEATEAAAGETLLERVVGRALLRLVDEAMERAKDGDLDPDDLRRQATNGLVRGCCPKDGPRPAGGGSGRGARRRTERRQSKAQAATPTAPRADQPSMVGRAVVRMPDGDRRVVGTSREGLVLERVTSQADDLVAALDGVDLSMPDGDAITLMDGRAQLADLVKHLVREGGVHTLKAPPGAGKSHAVRAVMVDEALRLGEDGRVLVVVPTHELAAEVATDYRVDVQARLAGALEQRGRDIAASIDRLIGEGIGDAALAKARAQTLHPEPFEPRVAVAVTRTADNCEMIEAVSAAASIHPKGSTLYCARCPLRGDCDFIRSQGSSRGAQVTIMTHALFMTLDASALAEKGEDYYDALIIDESIWGSMRLTGDMASADLERQQALGDVLLTSAATMLEGPHGPETTLDRLRRLMAESLDDPRRRITDAELRAQVDPTHIAVRAEYTEGATLIEESRMLGDPGDQAEHMRGGLSWTALVGLEHALRRQWRGVYIQGGRLHVAWARDLPDLDAQVTLALDATATELSSRAIYGRWAEHHDVRVDLPRGVEVIHVPWSAGTQSHADGEGGPVNLRAGAIVLGAWKRWAMHAGAVCVTHKRWLDEDTGGWLRDVAMEMQADCETRLLYFGHPAARGSNAFRDCDTIVLHAWHVPRGVRDQDAALLAERAGADLSDEVERVRWQTQAQWLLEGAEVEQVAARIRYLEASEDSPKRLVFVDRRDPTALGLAPAETVDPDLLALDEVGYLAPQGDDRDDWTPFAAMARLAGAAIDAHGSCYLPHADASSSSPVTIAEVCPVAWPAGVTGIRHAWQEIYSAARTDRLSQRLDAWRRRHFRGSWEDMAAALDLDHAAIETGEGGRALACLSRPDSAPRDEDVEGQLAVRGVRRWRWAGEDDWRYMRGCMSALRERLARVRGFHEIAHQGVTVGEMLGWLAKTWGVSARTVRRWVDEERRDGEGTSACLVRVWHEAANAWRFEQATVDAWSGGVTWREAATAWDAKHVPAPVWRDLTDRSAWFVRDDGMQQQA